MFPVSWSTSLRQTSISANQTTSSSLCASNPSHSETRICSLPAMDSSLAFTSSQRRPHSLANASSRVFRVLWKSRVNVRFLLLVSFIIIICYASSWCGGFTTLPICKMTFATIFFIIFMMDLDKQFLGVNWVWTDLFRAAVGAIFYIITSLINLIGGSRDGACMAGAVLGLFAGLIFAYDTYTIYLQIQSTRQHPAAPTDGKV